MKYLIAVLFGFMSLTSSANQPKAMKAIWTAPRGSVQKFIMAGHVVICHRTLIGSVKCIVNR